MELPRTRKTVASSHINMSKSKDHFHTRYYHPIQSLTPIPHLNATRRHIPIENKNLLPESESKIPTQLRKQPGAVHVWRARDNRKGRHAVVVDPDFESKDMTKTPLKSNSIRGALEGLWKMLVRYPIWDVSYDTAILFTIGKPDLGIASEIRSPDTGQVR